MDEQEQEREQLRLKRNAYSREYYARNQEYRKKRIDAIKISNAELLKNSQEAREKHIIHLKNYREKDREAYNEYHRNYQKEYRKKKRELKLVK
jgi:hypothetical protein